MRFVSVPTNGRRDVRNDAASVAVRRSAAHAHDSPTVKQTPPPFFLTFLTPLSKLREICARIEGHVLRYLQKQYLNIPV